MDTVERYGFNNLTNDIQNNSPQLESLEAEISYYKNKNAYSQESLEDVWSNPWYRENKPRVVRIVWQHINPSR